MHKNKILEKKLALVWFLLVAFFPQLMFGQTPDAEMDLGRVFQMGVVIFFAFVFFILITLIVYHNREEEVPKFVKAWHFIKEKLSGAAPIEKEDTILLEHDYDGIKELDNVLPPWWKYLFYATIVFAVIYLVDFHVINISPSSAAEYDEEVNVANIRRAELMGSGAFITAKTVTLLTDQASLYEGAEIFKKNCAACHGLKGEGLVGPNLTDANWIHGGGIRNVFNTITNGVPEKGMLSWKTQLRPKQIQEVGSYVLSLFGTNPPNAKPPQGDVWVEPVDTAKVAK